MSKKKNTLSDLEEFLKIQASSLVTPSTLTEKIKKEEEVVPVAAPVMTKVSVPEALSEDDLAAALQQLSARDKKAFYNLIVKTTKNLPNYSSEDVLLINTALYLKGGSNWKETVRDFWKRN